MTSQLGKLPFLLGDLCIITRGLVIRTYFRMIQHISLPFVAVRFCALPHLYGKLSIIPVSSLVCVYF